MAHVHFSFGWWGGGGGGANSSGIEKKCSIFSFLDKKCGNGGKNRTQLMD